MVSDVLISGFDTSMRLLAIGARRDKLLSLIAQHQVELNDLAVEEQQLKYFDQSLVADIPDHRRRASQEYEAAYIKEILDL